MAELKRIPGLEPRIARTKAALWRLGAARSFWPLAVFVSVFLIMALTGLIDAASEKVASVALILFLAGLLPLAALGAARFRPPTRPDAIRLLDRQSELRPLSTLSDRPSRPDATGAALWRAHEAELTDAARRLNVPDFASRWKKTDPFYLRYLLPLLLAGAALLAASSAGERLSRAFGPDIGSLFGAETIRIEAWITPPEHTGKPPVFLSAGQGPVRVPAADREEFLGRIYPRLRGALPVTSGDASVELPEVEPLLGRWRRPDISPHQLRFDHCPDPVGVLLDQLVEGQEREVRSDSDFLQQQGGIY